MNYTVDPLNIPVRDVLHAEIYTKFTSAFSSIGTEKFALPGWGWGEKAAKRVVNYARKLYKPRDTREDNFRFCTATLARRNIPAVGGRKDQGARKQEEEEQQRTPLVEEGTNDNNFVDRALTACEVGFSNFVIYRGINRRFLKSSLTPCTIRSPL